MLNDQERNDLTKRLRRIAGQINGIEKMVNDKRYCVDILQQVVAARSALNQVGLKILESHTKSCVVNAVQEDRAEESINELMTVLSKFTK
ncbi:MAG: metal-sensitive transcriptional regulator [Veillonellaceae bacterium]|jgi:DNA-binding FrmR family transcriptional regulator|nr:metal-sensitive transcriptional regulator [Veillonellaceae bacterium]